MTLDELVKEILAGIIPTSLNGTYFGEFILGAAYRIIIQPYMDRRYAAAIVFSYTLSDIILYKKNNGVITKIVPNSVKTVI